MIITGAPVENLEFEEVDYWDELCEIMDWTRTHVHSGGGARAPPRAGQVKWGDGPVSKASQKKIEKS